MTGRDDFADELLSAYLDGEVSSQEREQIAQRLATDAEYRSELESLQALQAALQDLPRFRLAPEVHDRIMRDVMWLVAEEIHSEQPSHFEGELLSAYFDGEVTDEERQVVEHALAASSRCRRRLDQLRELDAALHLLPTFHLGDDFADRVRQRIAAESPSAPLAEAGPAELVQPAARRNVPADKSGWRPFVWSALAVAAAVVLMVHLRGSPDASSTKIASNPPQPTVASPLTLVNKRVRDRLVLVYEVSVTPEGADGGAFFRLLKRHGIRIVDTVPVPERDQRALLACRFAQGCQSVSTDAAGDIDQVRMYLVYCAARQADDMWKDLMTRPEGVASTSLSLTTRRAGNGVLPRLAAASGIKRKVGEAFQLEANFGILSSVGRQVGAFGTIGYIDPDLLSPPDAPGELLLTQAEEEAGAPQAGKPNEAQLADDIPCELLYVVRKLRPLERNAKPRVVSMAK
jgi:anti-sigma factor RsiW